MIQETASAHGHLHHAPRDYTKTPMNIYWEMTQSCRLACRHCRAEAISTPHPLELNYEESVAFVHQIPNFGAPLPQLILTGGDPLARADLFDLIEEARKLGISISITPALPHEAVNARSFDAAKGAWSGRIGPESRWIDGRAARFRSVGFAELSTAPCGPSSGREN